MIRRIASTGRTLEDGVEDEETRPPLDEPEDLDGHEDEPEPEEELGDEDEDDGPAAGGSRLSTPALLAFAAVLVVFAMVMTALYVRERGAQADSDRLLVESNAQLGAVQDQLNAARGGPSLDPKGYEAIKQCVQRAADQEKMDEEVQKYIESQRGMPTGLPTPFPTGLSTTFLNVLPRGAFGATDLKVCQEALPYLN